MPDSMLPGPKSVQSTYVSGGVTVVPAEPEEGFGMAESDWDRLYRHVSRIRERKTWPENLLWAALAISVGAASSWLGWLDANGTLPAAAQAAVEWEGWVFGAVAVTATLVTALCFIFTRHATNQLERDKDDILEDIREIHPPRSGTRVLEVADMRHYAATYVGQFVRCSCGQSFNGPGWDRHVMRTQVTTLSQSTPNSAEARNR